MSHTNGLPQSGGIDQNETKGQADGNAGRTSAKALIFVLAMFIIIGAAYGVYHWQHSKTVVQAAKTLKVQQQVNNLNKQLDNLKQSSSSTSSQSSSSSSSSPAAINSCQTSGLALSLGQPNGTAGTTYIDLIFTNTSPNSCTLSGYPKVVLVDSQSKQLGEPAANSASTTTGAITLSPSQTAHVSVGFPSSGNFSPGTCSANSTSLEVTPPGGKAALQAALSQQYCPGFSVTLIQSGN